MPPPAAEDVRGARAGLRTTDRILLSVEGTPQPSVASRPRLAGAADRRRALRRPGLRGAAGSPAGHQPPRLRGPARGPGVRGHRVAVFARGRAVDWKQLLSHLTENSTWCCHHTRCTWGPTAITGATSRPWCSATATRSAWRSRSARPWGRRSPPSGRRGGRRTAGGAGRIINTLAGAPGLRGGHPGRARRDPRAAGGRPRAGPGRAGRLLDPPGLSPLAERRGRSPARPICQPPGSPLSRPRASMHPGGSASRRGSQLLADEPVGSVSQCVFRPLCVRPTP
ncbi:hypothetical protein SAMN02745121_01068 [Nannocystis exedens]|uniref:Uncharacterized protein n=1 Tax=Nannocystis exedens TaxID=54 RepID=A0A1I1U9K2_9BACT|nr:hypothetical protein NAEX_04600 [Nannocystis exedens]SFD67364.1 hypothetical protein SAMN02745121_01068 [Nannocystis exedens]